MTTTINVELICVLHSKQQWVNRVPAILGDLAGNKRENLIWTDKNGNGLTIGLDFTVAEVQNSYPVRVYRHIRVSEVKP